MHDLNSGNSQILLEAALFAAKRHKNQRRKGLGAIPYINHPIEVAQILTTVGQVADINVLVAALLHDTIEDTETTSEEISELFNSDVASLVEEVTDDKAMTKDENKKRQVETAPNLSDRAKLIRIADKISNVADISHTPPPDWTLERKRHYLRWGEEVVNGCRGVNVNLERMFDEVVNEGWNILNEHRC